MDADRIHRAVSDDGTDIAGRVHGHGPPLVLVHGALFDGETNWFALLPFLRERHTCYTMDLRGRGRSGQGTDLSPERLVQDVTAFAESIGEPVGLVGHSGGARLALGAAARTTAVSAVAAYEPPVFEAMSEEVLADFLDATARMAGLAAAGRPAEAARVFFDLVATDDELAAMSAMDSFELLAPNVTPQVGELEQLFEPGALNPTDPAELARVTVPVLLLHGTRSPGWFVEGVRRVADQVPDPRVQEIADAGHGGPLSAPAQVAEQLVGFLATPTEPA